MYRPSFYIRIVSLYSLITIIGIGRSSSQSSPPDICDCVYPIIFVHGWTGGAYSWEGVYADDDFVKIWGPLEVADKNNLYPDHHRGHVYHANLNATPQTNIRGKDNRWDTHGPYSDDDVILHHQFTNTQPLKKGCLYVINFNTSWNQNPETPAVIIHNDALETPKDGEDSDSNESALYKQGYALGRMITNVLEVTQKDKVILVGHSMGGLAIREYLQRKEGDKHPWWVDSMNPSGHHVARVLTASTPHRGANKGDFIPPIVLNNLEIKQDLRSEAVRDLRFSFNNDKGDPNAGLVLYGGLESIMMDNAYNTDINCDGDEHDEIFGLNAKGITLPWEGTYDNRDQTLPHDIKYTYYVGTLKPFKGDGIVPNERQWLYDRGNGSTKDYVSRTSVPAPNSHGDYVTSDRITSPRNLFHTDTPKDIDHIIRGIDEPDYPFFAYDIDLQDENISDDTGWYSGMVQKRADIVPLSSVLHLINGLPFTHNQVDPDWYRLILNECVDTLTISFAKQAESFAILDFFIDIDDVFANPGIEYLPTSQPDGAYTINMTDQESFRITSGYFDRRLYNISMFQNSCISSDTLYLRITHLADGTRSSWSRPYKFRVSKGIVPVEEADNVDTSSSKLSHIEYWFNDTFDQRQSLGTANASSISGQALIETSNLSEGLHTFHWRARDDQLSYSSVSSSLIYKPPYDPDPSIVSMEYWVDDAFDQRKSMGLTESAVLNDTLRANTAELTPGLHVLHYRYKDRNGSYSAVTSSLINKAEYVSAPIVTTIEYWYNKDFQLRESMSLSDTTMSIDSLNLNIDHLDPGLHILHWRVRDAQGEYSVVSSSLVYRATFNTDTTVKYIEYWLDDSPDQRFRTAYLSSDTLLILDSLNVEDIADGLHNINLRFLDSNGQSSVVITQLFRKSESRIKKISGYSYWFNEDDSTAMYVELAEPDSLFRLIDNIGTGLLSDTTHQIFLRFEDDAGGLSPVIEQDFVKSPVDTALIAAFTYVITSCGDVILTDGSVGDILSYEWDFGDQSMPSTDYQAVHVYNSFGSYNVCLTVSDSTMSSYGCEVITLDETLISTLECPESLVVLYLDTNGTISIDPWMLGAHLDTTCMDTMYAIPDILTCKDLNTVRTIQITARYLNGLSFNCDVDVLVSRYPDDTMSCKAFLPDLTGTLSIDTSFQDGNDTILVDLVISNIGMQAADRSTYVITVYWTDTFGIQHDYIFHEGIVSPLLAGDAIHESLEIIHNTTWNQGVWNMEICVDDSKVITESNELNNCHYITNDPEFSVQESINTSKIGLYENGFVRSISDYSDNPFSLDAIDNEYEVSLIPNPTEANVLLKIKSGVEEAYHISTMDGHGRRIFYTTTVPDTEVSMNMDLDSRPAGLYIVKITSNSGKTEVHKIIKAN